ncbi:MAG: DNA ligase D [Polyangiaceae bacterium]
MVRTGQNKDGKAWLLFKSDDEFASKAPDVLAESPNSVISGRDLSQIAKAAGTPVPKSAKPSVGVAAKLPQTIEPQLATLVSAPPEGDDWIHEIKFDGYRIMARIEAARVTLLSRNGKDWTDKLPSLAHTLAELQVEAALLDGELVALDENGLSDFQRLQNSLGSGDDSLVYYAFDLLHLDGRDLSSLPLTERKALLRRALSAASKPMAERVRFSEGVTGDGLQFFEKACALGLEGIVSKRAAAPYRPGRGRDWQKTKCDQRQEFVVVGHTEPGGSRSGLGALLLGLQRAGELTYAGRVGTGFSEKSLRELVQRLTPLQRKTAPVVRPPSGAAVRGVHWVRPTLVAEVAFSGFTQDGLLRHPRFQGLREDKPAAEVELERPGARRPATKRSAPPKSLLSYPITHPDKLLYPEAGITKRDLLEYYALVAPRMLPHVANRPLTLVRCPNGWQKQCFFQKHPGRGLPQGLRSVTIRESEGKAPYLVLDDVMGLLALVQLGALEIHTWGSRADDLERPDQLVFDLDPDTVTPFSEVVACALRLRDLFNDARLESFVKTTGGKGLHVCVPIAPDHEWPVIKAFCKSLVDALVGEAPDKYVATQSKSKRRGKIFIDYLRNVRGATFVAPYSTRARENAPIAMPLRWEELSPDFRPGSFTLRSAAQRLDLLDTDPFEPMAKLHQRLGKV